MFFLIGLGLGDPKDVTVKGLEIIKKCSRVYLEGYTSILSCGAEALVSNMIFTSEYSKYYMVRYHYLWYSPGWLYLVVSDIGV